MSARLISICLIVALLMVGRGLMQAAEAKPPDVPVNLKVDCQIETDLRPPESVSSDGELDVNAAIAQPEDVDVMPTEIEVLDVMPKPDAEGDADDLELKSFVEGLIGPRPEAISPGGVQSGGRQSEHTCPYLKQKAAEAEAATRESPGLVNSVLDNLNKLLEAEKLYRRAERCRRHGETDKACHWYEVVQHLCPGSRYDRLSAKRLKKLHAVQDAEAAEMEAEESTAAPIPIEAQVAELLEACQRALADGRCGEARDLADRALALDPACVAAKALVIKTHALSHRHHTTETADGEEASSCDSAEGSQPQTTEKPSPAELDIELLFRPADPEKSAECDDDACLGVR
ncbi:MAG TPA: hypothetical protein VKI65_00450, partial [Gemmataceae bacterium]|nr:hypothetical protein [Gemmataceae bacterium]